MKRMILIAIAAALGGASFSRASTLPTPLGTQINEIYAVLNDERVEAIFADQYLVQSITMEPATVIGGPRRYHLVGDTYNGRCAVDVAVSVKLTDPTCEPAPGGMCPATYPVEILGSHCPLTNQPITN